MSDLTPASSLEESFDMLARALDQAGPTRETLFLAKLSLALAARIGDNRLLAEAIKTALDGIVD
jgi:hypothetical protein